MVATRLVEVTAKGTEWAYGGGGGGGRTGATTSTPGAGQSAATTTTTTTRTTGGTSPEGVDPRHGARVGRAAAREQRSAGAGPGSGTYSPSRSTSSSSPSSTGYDTPNSRRSVSPFSSSRATHQSLSSSPYYGWNDANNWSGGDGGRSIWQAVLDTTYDRISQVLASLYSGGGNSVGYYDEAAFNRTRTHSNMGTDASTDHLSLTGREEEDDDGAGGESGSWMVGRPARRKSFTLAPGDLMMMFHNPYNSVRGRDHSSSKPASISAVRALLALVPVTAAYEGGRTRERLAITDVLGDEVGIPSQLDQDQLLMTTATPLISNVTPPTDTVSPLVSPTAGGGGDSGGDDNVFRRALPQRIAPSPPTQPQLPNDDMIVSPSETASQIAEGTIRAMRDLLCDEAEELRSSLRFWTERWERPIYSWLEAGPHVWLSSGGYNHQLVGRKVAQIQSVLARRCATIGELQQHLLKAGWQRGVAQWGMLGHGGEWAAVVGFDGSIPEDLIAARQSFLQRESRRPGARKQSSSSASRDKLLRQASSTASIHVQNTKDGGLFVDDPSFLAEWSVDAIALVRRLLKAASGGRIPIPHEENWTRNRHVVAEDLKGAIIVTEASDDNAEFSPLPAWVSDSSASPGLDISAASVENRPGLIVTNLPLLVEEVGDLLTVMEEILGIQRKRRVNKFRPPPWLRRNWFVIATVAPPISYFLHKVSPRETVALVVQKIRDFFRDHLKEPLVAIFNEIWKGRESFSDKQARMEAMESLKKMIRSWLDDTFPNMPEAKRISLSEAMDVTLLEQQKVESMKTFFEINNVIRMSFIEMQYMKKELLNALSAIDEMMAANDINMNMAAITPVAMLVYLTTRLFRFFFYALLKLGTSKEETYASFRHVLTDIERLLVMRDNPPIQHPSNLQGLRSLTDDHQQVNDVQELCADDLGMIMLLIHECRSILWRSRRRFNADTVRSVYEDLSELAGERGAVSVRQQLQILERMSRTYRFLQMRHI